MGNDSLAGLGACPFTEKLYEFHHIDAGGGSYPNCFGNLVLLHPTKALLQLVAHRLSISMVAATVTG